MSEKEIERTLEEEYYMAYKAYGLLLRKVVDVVNRINIRKNLPEPIETLSLEKELDHICDAAKEVIYTRESQISRCRSNNKVESKNV